MFNWLSPWLRDIVERRKRLLGKVRPINSVSGLAAVLVTVETLLTWVRLLRLVSWAMVSTLS